MFFDTNHILTGKTHWQVWFFVVLYIFTLSYNIFVSLTPFALNESKKEKDMLYLIDIHLTHRNAINGRLSPCADFNRGVCQKGIMVCPISNQQNIKCNSIMDQFSANVLIDMYVLHCNSFKKLHIPNLMFCLIYI